MFNNFFFPKSCRLSDNVETYGARGAKYGHIMAHTSCMLDNKGYMHAREGTRPRSHAHAREHAHKYVILIAFPRQQWLRERASMLRYTCTVCLVILVRAKPKTGGAEFIIQDIFWSLFQTFIQIFHKHTDIY